MKELMRHPWSSYVAALLLVGIAAVTRMLLLPELGYQAPYLTFYPAVMIAALLGGLSAGLFATGLAAGIAAYYWIEPVGEFALRSYQDRLGLLVFLLSCTMVSVLSALMRRAEERANEAEAQLKLAAEQALKNERANLITLVQTIPDLVWLKDSDGVYLTCNRAFERFFEASEEDIVGKTDYDFAEQKLAHFLREKDRSVELAGVPRFSEEWVTFPDGRRALLETIKTPLFADDGRSIGMLGIGRDITERKRMQRAQETSIALLRICNQATDKVTLIHDLTRFFQQLTGCEAIGVRLRQGDDFPYFETTGFAEDFVLAENRLCARDQHGELLRDGVGHPALDCMCGNIICGRFDPSQGFFTGRGSFWSSNTTALLASTTDAERQARTRNRCNGEGYESVALVPLRSQGEIFGLFQFNDRRTGRFTPETISQLEDLVSYVAIALAKLIGDEERLSAAQRLQLATASGGLGIWDWDIRQDLLLWDDRMFEIYRVNRKVFAASHGVWEKSLHPDDRARTLELTRKALAGEREYDLEFRIVVQGGSIRHIKTSALINRDADGRAVRMIGMDQDITDRKHLEEQLLQSQKMEAIGLLAGGIAHDFNNILTAIIGYASLLEMKLAQDDPRKHDAGQILVAADRATDLTRSLLAFSRKQILNPQPHDLNRIIQKTDKFLHRIIGEDIELRTTLTLEELTVCVDGGQIEQVLMNLATNARDAMPTGGVLSISTAAVVVETASDKAGGHGASGKHALLRVSDTGQGMDETTRKRLFEPFFTTKELGRGTGLGLSIAYGIVQQHNGFIEVSSVPGEGATFAIYLPLIATPVMDGADAPGEIPQGGTETILLVDDDQAIRELAKAVLGKFGYTVITAANGREAVDTFSESGETIDLVVMDTIMPKKNGKEAVEEIRKIRPACKVIFISGYTADIIHKRSLLEESLEFVAKPLDPLKFLKKVRQVLDQPD